MQVSIRRFAVELAMLLVSLVLLGALANGQQLAGTVRGKAVDATTKEGLVGANVLVPGTNRGTATDLDGNFSLSLPPGRYTIEVRMVGYTKKSESITVAAGGTVELPFELQQDVLKMDEVVVTGTGGLAASKARLGNSIGTINVDNLQKAPVTSIQQALDGKTTGVQILNSSGIAGVNSIIQLRGVGSITGNNSPLIMVDGVRMSQVNTWTNDGNNNSGGTYDGRGGQVVSTLNLINPADIERVEILKGASAATLYGSDAANGVIQIFTKSGSGLASGTTNFQYTSEYKKTDWSIYDTKITRAAAEVVRFNPGISNSNQFSITGAGAQYKFYSSAYVSDAQSGVMYNRNENRDFKANFTYFIDDANQIKVGAGYVRDDVRRPDADNSTWSPWFHALYKHDSIAANQEWRNPMDGRLYRDVNIFDKYKISYMNRRYSGNVEYVLKLPYRHNLEARIGYENLTSQQVVERNAGFVLSPAGFRLFDNRTITAYNGQLLVTGSYSLTDQINADVSYGIDYYKTDNDFLSSSSGTFTAGADQKQEDGDPTTFAPIESHTSFSSGSMFLQSQFDFYKSLFLTLGGRIDKSSSFGVDAEAQFYPKASVSYLLPTQTLNPYVSLAKIRGSFGKAGRQPDIGAAQIALRKEALNASNQSFVFLRPGNPLLKPAVTTEYEIGADVAFLDNRLGVEVTYYRQRTTDDLFAVETKPSDGFGNRIQAFNVGEVESKGLEISVFGTPVLTDDVRWESRLNITTVDNKVLDDGGFPFNKTPFAALLITRVEKGHSIPEFYYGKQVFDEYGNMTVGNSEFRGKVLPTLTGNFVTTLTLFREVTVSFNFVGATGHKILNLTKEALRRGGIYDDEFTEQVREAFVTANAKPNAQRTPEEIEAIKKYWTLANRFSDEFLEDGSYIKLREAAISYSLPRSWVSYVGLKNIDLTLSAYNVFTITNYEGFDPEVSVGGASVLHRGSDSQSIPNPRMFALRTSITF
ncbi:MAG: TonB-dependent receptor [Ignavibacteria bacterium]|nr:TonB-dependent receptor [Ignavibacteria bacterium]